MQGSVLGPILCMPKLCVESCANSCAILSHLQLPKILTQAEQILCNEEGLFETLSNKFKLKYNETIKSL